MCRAKADDETANLVFKGSFIPRRLDEVSHFERDAARIASGGDTEGIYYQTVTGLATDLSGVRLVPSLLSPVNGGDAQGDKEAPAGASPSVQEPAAPAATELAASDESESTSSSDTASDSDGDASVASGEEGVPRTWAHRPDAPTREEVRNQRRLNKEAVKEAKRERRKTKIPKGKKKRLVKGTSGKK